MARTVSVKLQADVGAYKKGMAEAGKATRDVDDAIDEVGKNDGLDKAGAKAKKLGDATGQTRAKAVADFAEIVKQAGALDRQIALTHSNLRSLARGYANTGGDKEIGAAIKEQQRQLSDLTNIRKHLPSPADLMKAGQDLAGGVSSGFGATLRSALPTAFTSSAAAVPIAAIAAPMGLSLASFLSAAAAGGILGGAATGGVVGGLVVASRDARVQGAAKNLSAYIGAQLQDAALPFVDGALDGLALVEQSFNRMDGDIDAIFGDSAAYLPDLIRGVTGLIEQALGGIRAAVSQAGPVIDVLRVALPEIGRQIGDLFANLADNAPAAALALQQLFGMISIGVNAVAGVINGLTEVYGWAAKLGLMGASAQRDFVALEASQKAAAGASQTGSSSMQGFMRVIEDTGTAAAATSAQFVSMAEAVDAATSRNLSAAEALLRVRDAAIAARDAADGKRGVNIAEEQALLGYARSLNAATKALDEQGRTAAQATAAHETNRAKLVQAAMAMSYTKAQALALADQYLAIPKNITTKTSMPGGKEAEEQAKRISGEINRINKSPRIRVYIDGDGTVRDRLADLLVAQQALKKGVSVSAARSAFNKNAFADGGYTGPGAKYEPAGVVHADEWVIRKESTQRLEREHPGALDYINREGRLPGYADGGQVTWPFPATAAMTRIPSRKEALSAVTPAAPSGGATAPFMVRVLREAFPGLAILSTFRPGARTLSGRPSLHGLNRAVDTDPDEAAARFMYGNYKGRLKESITPFPEWNVLNGRDHRYTGAVWAQHNFAGGNAHNHFAMANGGVIREPVFGVGASGRTYSFGEGGRPEAVVPLTGGGRGGAAISVTLQFSGPIGNQAELENWVVGTVDKLRSRDRI